MQLQNQSMSMPRLAFSDIAPSSIAADAMETSVRKEQSVEPRVSPKQALLRHQLDNQSKLKDAKNRSSVSIMKFSTKE